MACTHPYWSELQVGSQHLARKFANHGWKVHYFSAPVTVLHLSRIGSSALRKRLRFSLHGSTAHHNGNIFSYIPFSLYAPSTIPFLRNKQTIDRWHKTIIPPIIHQLKKYAINNVHLLYIDNIYLGFFLKTVKYRKSIFRVMDEHDQFQGWDSDSKTVAAQIAQRCDTVVYSAKGLETYVSSLKPKNAVLIPNGVDLSRFNRIRHSDRNTRHKRLRNIEGPFVLYSGMIDSRIDFDLIRSVALQNPKISFIFAGPFGGMRRPKNIPGNIHFLGPVPHHELPFLMQAAKAGIIPFDTNKLNRLRSIRPLKLFEYMAAGIPVISAKWPEVESLCSPAWLYETEEEFNNMVRQSVRKTYDPKIYNNFAAKHDWSSKFKLLIEKAEITL